MSVRLAAAQKSFILFFWTSPEPWRPEDGEAQAGNQPVRGRRKAADEGIIVKIVLHNRILLLLLQHA